MRLTATTEKVVFVYTVGILVKKNVIFFFLKIKVFEKKKGEIYKKKNHLFFSFMKIFSKTHF